MSKNIGTAAEASHHITGCYPLRVLKEDEREDYRLIHIVGFQRGFEQLEVAVYSDHGVNSGDAEEAAIEYLTEHFPDSLTEDEKQDQAATSVRRAARIPITGDEAVEFLRLIMDDALSVRTYHEWEESAQNADELGYPENAVLLGWKHGDKPFFVAVHSYLPGITLSDEEAIELATYALMERAWFRAGQATPPDFIIHT